MPNVFEPEFEADADTKAWPKGFDGRYAPMSGPAGAEHLGASLYEVSPGNKTCPYHWHAGNEEMLIVLAGTPTLRTPDGERTLAEGELVAFPVGEQGAHTVINRTDEPIRVLIVSEMNEPEVCVYPDSGKVMARQQAPGTPATGLRALFRLEDEVDYWEGEVEPEGGALSGPIGVVGAGTMGSGIAQVACLGGFEARLHDPIPEALAEGEQRLRAALEKGAKRGRWSRAEAEQAARLLRTAEKLDDLAGCELVIEAAPEDLDIKIELFGRLADVCGPEAVLATNTSSLSVANIAAGVPGPQRVVGMHFFNPPALMKLVEVVAGPDSSPEALDLATEAAVRMGRTPVRAADGIGFIANRCARPYSLEALRLLGDGIADAKAIDRICRIGGGFRMGPFELTDLVGVDVNLEVAKSFWEQSSHQPRWEPHPIQEQMVSAGRLGRKASRGYYDYSRDPYRPEDPDTNARQLLSSASGAAAVPGSTPEGLVFLVEGSLGKLDQTGGSIGYFVLGPMEDARLVELTAGEDTPQAARDDAETHFRSLGLHVEWVGDSPGLVLGRIVCQLVNEAAFALEEGIAAAKDIDTAMQLGLNYPRGPLQWGDEIGLDQVLTVLDALRAELGEERYAAAPLLRRLVADGKLGRSTGGGLLSA